MSTTETVTRAAPRTYGSFTSDEAHFQAVDATMTITPRVTAGGPCVASVPLSPWRYRACAVSVTGDRFTRHTARIIAVNLLAGRGRATVDHGRLVFRPGANGPYTARVSVRLRRDDYVSTATLTIHVLANAHFAPGKDFPG